ncbi:NAD-dependent epimerase/dehydratase family protein [Rhodobacter sp. 24-YEA-8]|uniref:NAD-dependent epimerase/dehydratase family protein n=1 Tax=Rhodobacter sp. 24-YEA-8 TaxID=1884310 RepID=UPI00089CF212|nr:NAD-dependent epimerase/dehydratase family protein [Rhodobacter sp. 24-YEA-8]SED47622.1 Nucleoside-diphosphate-sugar epimerase [Rhodobacter sp. 24-YEA-8]
MQTTFVTGATGLLGNNLVRLLLARGVTVRALARSRAKAEAQFGQIPGLEIIEGDMQDVAGFAPALAGCDVVFHTAAYFRESYGGGKHWAMLKRINVDATAELIAAAHAAGVRRFIHTSSIAVVNGPRGELIDESMKRGPRDADDYYRSKMQSDAVVQAFLRDHPEMFAAFVMPGWMHGRGDLGPTAAGQFTLDYLKSALPGIPPGTFAFVDACDVAFALVAAAEKGRRGEHYLAAGHHIAMPDLVKIYAEVTGTPAPKRQMPVAVLWPIAVLQEVVAFITRRPALLSLATVRTMRAEAERRRSRRSMRIIPCSTALISSARYGWDQFHG